MIYFLFAGNLFSKKVSRTLSKKLLTVLSRHFGEVKKRPQTGNSWCFDAPECT